MPRARKLPLFLVTAALLTLLAQLAFAQGAPASARAGEHCAYDTTSQKVTCYPTFKEVVESISGGRVSDITDPHTLTQQDVSRIASTSAGAAANPYVLGVLYEHSGFAGATFTVTGNSGCDDRKDTDADWDFYYYLGGYPGWSNVVSSFKGFSNCWVKVYEARWVTCSYHACQGPIWEADLGTMSDSTNFVRFY